MPRKHTSSFILELLLRTTAADDRVCTIGLEAARNIANAVLGEGRRRADLMRQSKAYQAARKMPRGARAPQSLRNPRRRLLSSACWRYGRGA
jgi:putative transposase